MKMTACLLLRYDFNSSSSIVDGEKLLQQCRAKYIEWARLLFLANRQIAKLHCRCPETFIRTDSSLIIPPAQMPNKLVDFDQWLATNDSSSTTSHSTLASDTDSDLTLPNYQTLNDVIDDSVDADTTATDTFSDTIVASHADMLNDVTPDTGRCKILSSTVVPPSLFSDTIVASHANMLKHHINVAVSHVSDTVLSDDDVTMTDTIHVFRDMSVTLVDDSCLMDLTYTINYGSEEDDDVTMQDAQDPDATRMEID